MNKLTPLLLSSVLLFGAVACSNDAKTATGTNSDQGASSSPAASPDNSSAASPNSSIAASPDSSPAASPSDSTAASSNTTNSDAHPDKAAKDDASSDTRRAQMNNDIRAREQRNNAANGGSPENRADGDLASEVRSKLEANLQSSKLEVKAKNGAVTVTGAVPNQTDLSKIDTLAKQIKGVKSVTNQAKVLPPKS